MKLGVVITMYNEHKTVIRSVRSIKESDIDSYIIVVHSDDDTKTYDLESIIEISDEYVLLPNLAKELSRFQIPAHSLCRNFSLGFSTLYDKGIDYDMLVAFTGDTFIFDSDNFKRRLNDLKNTNKIAFVSQAIGQHFHASTDDVENGIMANRLQTDDITDFMPQLFFVSGKEAVANRMFSNIELTNKYTSEQCLGDELSKYVEDNFFHSVGRLNATNKHNAYAYTDGVKLQYED